MKHNELQRRRRYRAAAARLVNERFLSARRRERRGVLLLVVLSVLILFMLVGTTFLLTSNQYQTAAKIMDKANRTTFQPEDVLERALMQLVRDTNNRHSALRYHSLLRDLYGGDGFVGQVNTLLELPRYAGVGATDINALGNTGGELIDIYVFDAGGSVLDVANVVGLDLDSNGLPIEYPLSSTNAYYNGCLLTMMEGPCRGQSVRVVDYDYFANRGLGRLRVVAPQRLDGQNLSYDTSGSGNPANNALLDFYDSTSGIGYRFMVNGRPFNGTGVGYNAYADTGDARLTAYEAIQFLADPIFGEVCLFPNSTYFTPSYVELGTGNLLNNLFYAPRTDLSANLTLDATNNNLASTVSLYDPHGRFSGPGDTDESYDAPDFQNMFLAQQALRPRYRGRVVSGNVSLDPAAYYQSNTAAPDRIDLDGVTIPSLHRPALANFWFHRLFNSQWLIDTVSDDQERVAAILDPYGQLGASAPLVAAQIAAVKRKFSMRPLRTDHPDFDGSNSLSIQGPFNSSNLPQFTNTANEITYPFWEAIGPWDVDNDGDGIPDSVWVDLGLPVQKTEDGRFYKPLVAMLVEDLDGRLNLNAHGSIEDFANAPLDQSNVAGNLAQDYNNPQSLFTSNQLPEGSGWGPADITLRSILSPDLPLYDFVTGSSLTSVLPPTLAQYDDYARLLVGRPSPDVAGRNVSRAVNLSVDFGRYGSFPASGTNTNDIPYYLPGRSASLNDGTNYVSRRENLVPFDFAGYPEFAGDLFTASGFGERPDLKVRYATALAATGTPVFEPTSDFTYNPTLALLDDSPYEIDLSAGARRGVPADIQTVVASYGTTDPIDEDALFSVAELERILRATDVDAGDLPDRLWNLVDAFDPEKLAVQRAIIDGLDPDNFTNFNPSSLQRVIAQSQAAINRRLVTTDSYDLPVPNENWTSRLLLGADGLPGVPQYDTNSDGSVDEGDDNKDSDFDDGAELGQGSYDPTDGNGTNDSDDYQVIMGNLPPSGARITDYLRYRVTLELLRNGTINASTNATRINTLVNQIILGDDTVDAANVRNDLYTFGGVLAPEVLAGHKMNINRPLGDGRDNNGNGVVDEPAEAGDTYTYAPNSATIIAQALQDMNGNGVFDQGISNTTIYVAQNNGYRFTAANLAIQDRNLDGVFDEAREPVVDYTWIDANHDGVRDLTEFHPFVHSQGRDINGRGSTAGGRLVADDAPLARQYLARHLYCLMLTLMDENYIAPYDSNDPQVLHYLDPLSRDSVAFQIKRALDTNPPPNYPWPGYSGNTTADAKRIALRKLTCRQIAQWAINCVDIRDPDSIQTPFEYDENPWDGWNVVSNYTDGSLVVYPIDSDLTTDENYGMYREIDATGALSNPLPATFNPNAVPAYYQTRGVVWGAERPELLLTEGLAWHDRRVQDLELGAVISEEADDFGAVSGDAAQIADQEADNDLDQQLKPVGRCYVELFNPWSTGALLGAELYRDPGNNFRRYDPDDENLDGTIDGNGVIDADDPFVEGLLLDRISDGISSSGYVSPVWRMACTETHPLIRNATVPDQFTIELNDDPYTTRNGGQYLDLTIEDTPWAYQTDRDNKVFGGVGGGKRGTLEKLPNAYFNYYNKIYNQTTQIINSGSLIGGSASSNDELSPRNTDPDFPSFDRRAQPIDFASSQLAISNPGLGSTGKVNRRILAKPIDYLERLFYFTGAPSVANKSRLGDVRDLTQESTIQLHIPQLYYDVNVDQTVISNLRRAARGELIDGSGDKLFLPDDGLSIGVSQPTFGAPTSTIRVHISRFAALDYFDTNGDHPTDKHEAGNPLQPVTLAPILPGHYGVVGSAGDVFGKNSAITDYDAQSLNPDNTNFYPVSGDFYDNLKDRYTSIVTRSIASQDRNPADLEFINPPPGISNEQVSFRRVEMIPSTNPFRHQFIFRMNGGLRDFGTSTEYPRTSEVIDLTPENDTDQNVSMVNASDPVQFSVNTVTGGGKAFTPVIQPVVAIPVEGFSISEPLDGYLIRQLELDPTLNLLYYKDPRIPNTSERPAQGAFVTGDLDLAGYDEPFDLLPELIENQTTPNYRTMHLQRLANPLLAWNPPPVTGAGKADSQHDSTRPVNPYLTTDSLSLDLTSLNSTSNRENVLANIPTITADGPEARHQVNRNQLPDDTQTGAGSARPYTKVTLQSQGKGLHGIAQGTTDALPSRAIWGQDRPTGTTEILLDDGVALKPSYKIFSEALGLNSKDRYSFGTDEDLAVISYKEAVIDYPLRHSLGFANRGFGKFYNFESLLNGTSAAAIDINGDRSSGELIGVPAMDLDASSTLGVDDVTTPVFHWPNRPFISESEVMLAPIWGSSRMLTYYSVYNPALSEQPNQYDGTAKVDNNGNTVPYDELGRGDAEKTNDERWKRMHTTFGHLPNFLATAGEASKIAVNGGGDIVAYGAPHFYRVLDYLHVPSRFIGTDRLLTPERFTTIPTNVLDPRRELVAPFNRVDNYREPGRVNLNTVVGRGDDSRNGTVLADPADRWSEVYDGLMHRSKDENIINYGTSELLSLGHLGPAWRDIEKSRRGYVSRFGTIVSHSPLELNYNFPTFFANPFRSAGEAANVPLDLMQQEPVVSSMLRPHHYSPGQDSAWGTRGTDDFVVDKTNDLVVNNLDANGVLDDASEAGLSNDRILNKNSQGTIPNLQYGRRKNPRVPLMSGAALEPSIDTERNPHLRYQPMTRLANLTSTRSGVFAVWMTVGFFEVTPANENPTIAARYFDTSGNLLPATEDLFFRIYPDGYTLGKEIGLDTGENQRHRGFYVVDRTLPVAFKPGEDLNVDKAVLLRRRIE